MNEHGLYAGERYRHYKGNLYQIVTVAMHTETEEEMVVYQALYGDYKVFVRPLKMFFETVKDADGNMVPRFAKVDGVVAGGCKVLEQIGVQIEKTEEIRKQKEDAGTVVEMSVSEPVTEGINPLLLEFLDAESSVERLEVLHRMRKTIDNKTISDIAAALDIVIEEKDMDERIRDLENCLQTRARFETTRLR